MKALASITRGLFCAALVIGCGDDTGSSSDSGETSNETGNETGNETAGPGSADPKSGVWDYEDKGIAENSCGNDVYRDPDTIFGLMNNNDGTFTVDQGMSAEDFDCTLNGAAFTCPERLYGNYPIEGIDATLIYNVSIEGSFSSDTAMSGQQRADVSCEGNACGLAPQVLGVTFPCSYTVDFEATAQ